MNQFEYIIPFVGIIYGLSATDILISSHRIIIEREKVKFHIVPFVWAVVAFLLIINGWWAFFEINTVIELENAGQLLVLTLLPLIAFLFCALSLPHKVEQGLDLWAYFYRHRVPFYLSMCAYLLLIPLIASSFLPNGAENTPQLLIVSAILIISIWIKYWIWHLVIGALYAWSLTYTLFNQTIV